MKALKNFDPAGEPALLIYLYACRKPERPLKEIWPDVKCYSC
ncbi:MAG TPA: hypothetical protein VF591_08060 [Pyrinomonadaceae bacterium]|jgi:hypothetical protein